MFIGGTVPITYGNIWVLPFCACGLLLFIEAVARIEITEATK